MDEAQELFFDATFSYLNTVFTTLFLEEASTYPEFQRNDEMIYTPTWSGASSNISMRAFSRTALQHQWGV